MTLMIRRPGTQVLHDGPYTGDCESKCVPLHEHPTLPYIYAFATLMERELQGTTPDQTRLIATWFTLSGMDVIRRLNYAFTQDLLGAMLRLEGDDTPLNRVLVKEAALRVSNLCLALVVRIGGIPPFDAPPSTD